jgi:hypothetical protein
VKQEYFPSLAALSRVAPLKSAIYNFKFRGAEGEVNMNGGVSKEIIPLDFKSALVYKANIGITQSIRKREVAHEPETPRLGGLADRR